MYLKVLLLQILIGISTWIQIQQIPPTPMFTPVRHGVSSCKIILKFLTTSGKADTEVS